MESGHGLDMFERIRDWRHEVLLRVDIEGNHYPDWCQDADSCTIVDGDCLFVNEPLNR